MRVISPLPRGIEQIHLHSFNRPEARRHLELAITPTASNPEKHLSKIDGRPGKPN
jgi:hypothetical protein